MKTSPQQRSAQGSETLLTLNRCAMQNAFRNSDVAFVDKDSAHVSHPCTKNTQTPCTQ